MASNISSRDETVNLVVNLMHVDVCPDVNMTMKKYPKKKTTKCCLDSMQLNKLKKKIDFKSLED